MTWDQFVEAKLFPKNMLSLTGQHFPVTLHFVLEFLNSPSQVFVLVLWQELDHHIVLPESTHTFVKGPFSSCEKALQKVLPLLKTALCISKFPFLEGKITGCWKRGTPKTYIYVWDHSFEYSKLQVLMKFMDWKDKMISLSQITRNRCVYKLSAPFCKCKSNICRCICFGWWQIGAIRWEKTGLIRIYWNSPPVMWLNWHVTRYPAEIPAILLRQSSPGTSFFEYLESLCRITCLATHAVINYIYFPFHLLIIWFKINSVSYP